ncbi:MAG TPA: hypothetical protein PK308_00280 [Phycisphaerales bacterium]|nr:hypothetical protein [Phycisphaerales bacterium]
MPTDFSVTVTTSVPARDAYRDATLFASAFPFPVPHRCPEPTPPKPPTFVEVLRLTVRPEYKQQSAYGNYGQPGEAPTLPDPAQWFTDVFMVCRTATVSGKRVQIRSEYEKLIVEVEK